MLHWPRMRHVLVLAILVAMCRVRQGPKPAHIACLVDMA